MDHEEEFSELNVDEEGAIAYEDACFPGGGGSAGLAADATDGTEGQSAEGRKDTGNIRHAVDPQGELFLCYRAVSEGTSVGGCGAALEVFREEDGQNNDL